MASSGLRARSRAAFLTGPTLAAFRIPGYPVLWLAGWAGGFGWAVSLVAIGWITLEVSNSAFAVGVAFAARLLPALLFGIPLGGLVDRFDRRTTLIVVNALSAASLFGVGLIAVAGHLGLTELLILSLGLGVIDTTRGTAYQSYVFDLAGPEGATNAIALGNMGGAFAGAVGSVTGGIVLEQVGVGATFWLAAAFAAAAAAGLALTGRTARLAPATPRLVPSFRRSLTLVVRNRRVALILRRRDRQRGPRVRFDHPPADVHARRPQLGCGRTRRALVGACGGRDRRAAASRACRNPEQGRTACSSSRR